MSLVLERRPQGAGVCLTAGGRLDAEAAGELRDAVAAEIRRGLPDVSLDLAGVTFLSSAGISGLLEAQRDTRAAGGDCLVAAASDPVRKVLVLTRLDRILMRPVDGARGSPPASEPLTGRDIEGGGVRLVGLVPPPPAPLHGRIHGSSAVFAAQPAAADRLRLPPRTFALGIGGVADEGALDRAGEMLAAGGTVYHRGPRPFAAVDYLAGGGDLVAEADLFSGLSWEGLPGGRAGFEPVEEGAAVGIDALAAAILSEARSDILAFVVAGEVHGLVAAELIRPLSEATPQDHPLAGLREVAARWLCFSREPVHAGRTAIVVGVVARIAAARGLLAESLAPLGPAGVAGHLHAVVFPHRPIRRAGGDLAAVLADLAASEPLAVLHLMADERPVLGSGTSGFVRGACWFAPLAFAGADA
jgi:anti-sigma B factor antagonist